MTKCPLLKTLFAHKIFRPIDEITNGEFYAERSKITTRMLIPNFKFIPYLQHMKFTFMLKIPFVS